VGRGASAPVRAANVSKGRNDAQTENFISLSQDCRTPRPCAVQGLRKGEREKGEGGVRFGCWVRWYTCTSVPARDSGDGAAFMDSDVVPLGLARFVVLSDMSIAS